MRVSPTVLRHNIIISMFMLMFIHYKVGHIFLTPIPLELVVGSVSYDLSKKLPVYEGLFQSGVDENFPTFSLISQIFKKFSYNYVFFEYFSLNDFTHIWT